MAGPRDSKHYSEKQLQAILKAKFIDGIPGAQIVRLAERGQLGNLPAFTVDKYYVYKLIKNNQDWFEDQNPEALAKRTYAALAKAHKANVLALEALADDTDPGERTRIAKHVAESQRTLNTTEPRTKTSTRQPADQNATTPELGSVVGTLLALAPKPEKQTAHQGARTGSLTDARSDPSPAA